MKISHIVSFWLLFTSICYGQTIKSSNFSISIYKGLIKTNCIIKNPFWLQQYNSREVGPSSCLGLELNQRVFSGFWVGAGMQLNKRNYTFNRIDPYINGNNIEKFYRTDKGQDFSLKIEYFKQIKGFDFSVLSRIKSQIWFSSQSLIQKSSGETVTRKDFYFLGSSYRPRIEYGFSIGHTIGKKHLSSLKIEPNFSSFMDVKNSILIDKMNLKSISLNFTFVKNFKPIL